MVVTWLAALQQSERVRRLLISPIPDLAECLGASTAGRRCTPLGPPPGTVAASAGGMVAVSVAGTGAGLPAGTVAASVAGMVVVSAAGMRPEEAVASAVGTATDTEPIDYRRVNHAHFDPCTQRRSGSSAYAVS
jgi:hypothetical protein